MLSFVSLKNIFKNFVIFLFVYLIYLNLDFLFGSFLEPYIGYLQFTKNFVLFFLFVYFFLIIFVLIENFFLRDFRTGKLSTKVPKLLRDIIWFLFFVSGIIAGLNRGYNVEISGLVATSGIAIAVLGFALRNMISDVFTGIALNIEKPLKYGDWIEIENGVVGRVEEINWRATKIVTREQITVVVSNNHLASTVFKNYSTPKQYFRDKFSIFFDYDVNFQKAERVLLSAINQVLDSVAIPEKPEVRIMEFHNYGVEWECRYWVTNYEKLSSIRYEVRKRVLNNLIYAGISPSRFKAELYDTKYLIDEKQKLSDEIFLLKSMDLFHAFSESEIEHLAKKLSAKLYKKGDLIVQQGDTTNKSLFIVKEGFLEVLIKNNEGVSEKVGWLSAGMFFGEMSLLTNEPRSASVMVEVDTILYEIDFNMVKVLLENNEQLAFKLSEALAFRQQKNLDKLNSQEDTSVENLKSLFFSKIKKIFF